jgi:hypothetical protein
MASARCSACGRHGAVMLDLTMEVGRRSQGGLLISAMESRSDRSSIKITVAHKSVYKAFQAVVLTFGDVLIPSLLLPILLYSDPWALFLAP